MVDSSASVSLSIVELPLIEPFRASWGTLDRRQQILIEIHAEGLSGWAECSVFPAPGYAAETTATELEILRNFAIPAILRAKDLSPDGVRSALSPICGHNPAKAALELAALDLAAKKKGTPLYQLLGGQRSEIAVGVVVAFDDDQSRLLDRIAGFVERGYARVKLKIAPDRDISLLELIRRHHPELALSVDANESYTREDFERLKALDCFSLEMIEQPLARADLLGHAILQRSLNTPICLDESIENVGVVETALELGSCKIISVKPSRLGGHRETIAVHDFAAAKGIGVWCGGMLETGIGRAHNMALATLPNFIYPGDISESARYYTEDIIDPPIALTAAGTLKLPDRAGIGFEVRRDVLQRYLVSAESFNG